MTPQKIKKDIENHFGIPDLSTKERTRPLPQLRYLFFKIVQEYHRNMILSEIGSYVNRDHATVIWGLSCFEHDMKHHPEIKQYYESKYRGLIPIDVNLLKGMIYV